MGSLKGKKLLILGASANEISIVERAKELGIYTIVTDYNKDHRLSPAKDAADEYWDISWGDMDALEKRCRAELVDGITAGYSEIRVDNLIKLCSRLGLPCFAKDESLEITRNKDIFKSECRKYGIPVIKEYESIDDIDRFPVIVKPTDRGGSLGVGIAHNRDELKSVYEYALENSIKKKVIIEEYITEGNEFDVHYGIIDGKIYLLSSDDVIHAKKNEEDAKVIQSGWFSPIRYEDKFLKDVDPQMRNLISSLGIENGTIFFSGFVSDTGDMRFFECGFRLWGPQEYKFTEKKGLVNFLDIYIYHALLGNCKDLVPKGSPNNDLKYAAEWIYSKAGKISSIEGFEEVKKHPLCTQAILYCYIGQECSDDKAILSRLVNFEFASEDPKEIKDALDFAYRTFKVKGENGEDMIYDRIDTDMILRWWDR